TVIPKTADVPHPELENIPQRIKKEIKIQVDEVNQADILVVIDNSVSMQYEQSSMAKRFESFTSELKNLDWQLGIITTDVSSDAPKKDGRLLRWETLSDQYWLHSQMPAAVVEEAFAKTIQRPPREGSQFEQGIKATYRFLERHSKDLRPSAALNVILVSDADETPVRGTSYEDRNKPEKLLNYIKENFPDKSFYFHSLIVQEGDIPCLKAENNEAYGRQYAWLSEKTKGIVGSVCAEDYSSQLKMIGEKVSQKVVMTELGCSPVLESLSVKSETSVLSSDQFSIQDTRLLFSEPLKPGQWTVAFECSI
ncbi:MAG: vWA domain-containing protein, partial [Bdellovibrionales bacterium]